MSALAGGRLQLDFPADHVARLTIDNQAKRNALDRELLDAFAAALGEVECRCLLLTAAGSIFSAGYDIGDLPGGDPSDFEQEAEEVVAHPFEAALAALDAFRFPVVAALNGHAIGGGLELALACDLRIAAAGAKLGMPPARLGLIYSHTGLRRFVDAVGAPRTRELFFTARNVTAEVALEWGLVNRVVADEELAEAAVEWAAGIAGNAPLSLEGNKGAMRALLAAEGALAPEVERELVALREACFRSEDFREGVRAFAEKRPPEWKGRYGRRGPLPEAAGALSARMSVVRFVLVAVAATLVVTAVAWPRPLQDPPPVPPTPTPIGTPPVTTPTPAPTSLPAGAPPDYAEIAWPAAPSRALGKPFRNGRLVDGVQLPELGEDFFTWDPVFDRIPNRPWRRWGTDRLIRTVLTVIHEYRTAHDGAPRIGIMDLSRPQGGFFGKRYGGLGHDSHQNGLDADVLYPRVDGLERRAYKPSVVDRKAAQELVDRFVAAGAQKIFVGPHLHLRGPRNVVIPLVYHDDHMHVRIHNVRR